MSQIQERHEDYMKRRLREEGTLGVNTEYTNMRLTKEIEELKNRILLDYPDLGYTSDEVVPVLGNAGDLIIFDTDLFHLGGVVKENNERLIIRGHTR